MKYLVDLLNNEKEMEQMRDAALWLLNGGSVVMGLHRTIKVVNGALCIVNKTTGKIIPVVTDEEVLLGVFHTPEYK